MRRGEFPGKPPIGYRNEPRLCTIVVDPDTAPLVCRMFKTYATGRFTLKEVRQQVAAFGLVNREGKPLDHLPDAHLDGAVMREEYLGRKEKCCARRQRSPTGWPRLSETKITGSNLRLSGRAFRVCYENPWATVARCRPRRGPNRRKRKLVEAAGIEPASTNHPPDGLHA